MTKKNIDRIVLILFILMSILLYQSTANYSGIAKTTSASYVKFLSVFIGGLSVIQLILNILKDKSVNRLVLSEHLPRFFGLLIALIIFALAFEHLGFFISAGIFIPVVSLILGYRNYLSIALTTVGVLIFVYLIFVTLLSVNLPSFDI